MPPTSQNQRTIEEDLRGVVERSLDVPDDELALLCEQTIRNYDPCISCATHFLKLEVERTLKSRLRREPLARRRRGRARGRRAASAGTLPAGVEVLEREGEPTALIDAWEGADARLARRRRLVRAPAGTIHRLDASERDAAGGALPRRRRTTSGWPRRSSSPARSDGCRARLVVYGIEGESFEVGDELTPEVAAAVERVADAVREEVVACTSER